MTICEVRCSYCKCLLGHKEIDLPDGHPAVTHGICQLCFDLYIEPEFDSEAKKLAKDIFHRRKEDA